MKPALWISLFGLLVTIPHVVEDFVYGVPQKYGLDIGTAGALLAAGYFLQTYAVVLLSERKKGGLFFTFLIGVLWLAGAVWDHLPDLLRMGHYREGMISKVWIVGIIGWAVLLIVATLSALRHPTRR